MNNSRMVWIDSLKGLAILGIIMIHSGGAKLPDPLGIVARFGGSGVQLFFVISALLTFLSLEKVSTCSRCFVTYSNWFLKKVISLCPLYYLTLVLSILVTGGNSYWYGSEGGITIWNVISHVTFTWGFVPHYCNSIMGGEWYLGTLVIFWIMAPFLFRIINSFERSIVFFFCTTITCKYINAFVNNRIPETPDSYIYEVYFRDFWIFAQLPVLALGICLFFIFGTICKIEIKEKRLLSGGLLLFSIIMLWGQMNYRNALYDISESTLIAFWFILLIISQSIYRNCLINNFIFRILGQYSYTIYLFHGIVIYFFDKYISISTGYCVLDWCIKYFAIIAIMLLWASLMDKYIDKPYREWIKRWRSDYEC